MKETSKLQLEILQKKKENIEKNISNIQSKARKLEESLNREVAALERVNKTLRNFGKSKSSKENSDLGQNSQKTISSSSAFGKEN